MNPVKTKCSFKASATWLVGIPRVILPERPKLVGQIAAGNKVVVDLSSVASLSYSYADELFGVLAAIKGWDWLTKNSRLIGANEHVLRVIAEAIDRRLKETGQPVKRSA